MDLMNLTQDNLPRNMTSVSLHGLYNGFIPEVKEVDTYPIIAKLNQEESERQIPLAVFLGLVAFSGFIGNSVVWYVYGFLYRASNSRVFIVCLAIVDLCTCVFAMPVEIVTVMNQFQFDKPWTCKISRLTNSSTTISSASILLLIAMDRYRKICRPLMWQFSNRQAMFMCIGAIAFGAFLGWPSIVLYGVKSTEKRITQDMNGNVTECSIDDDYKNTPFPLLYQLLFLVSFLLAIGIITVLYTIIGRRVRFFAHRHEIRRASSSNVLDDNDTEVQRHRQEKLRSMQSDVSSFDDAEDSLGLKRSGRMKAEFKSTENIIAIEHDTTVVSNTPQICQDDVSKSATLTSTLNTKSLSSNANIKLKKKRKALARNTTYLMLIISIVFVLNFVPYLVLVLLREVKSKFVENLTDSGRTAYRFLLRSYFLNAAVNPIIYSIFDRRFRKALRKCLLNIRESVCRCRSTS